MAADNIGHLPFSQRANFRMGLTRGTALDAIDAELREVEQAIAVLLLRKRALVAKYRRELQIRGNKPGPLE